MKRYLGSCHCGKVQFEIQTQIENLRVCNCSVCHKRGALITRVEEKQFTLLSSWDELTVYQWGSLTAKDYFCKSCGILPFRKSSALTNKEKLAGKRAFLGWSINARCLKDFEPDSVEILCINGRGLELSNAIDDSPAF